MKAAFITLSLLLIVSVVVGLPMIDDSNDIISPNHCINDSQCRGGSMCFDGACKSIFSCKPLVNATWTNRRDLTAGGQLEVKNPEYLEIVPINLSNATMAAKKEFAVRFHGGHNGVHTFERVVLKRFNGTKDVWGGTVLVNLNKFNASYSPVLALLGGYKSEYWPDSVPTAWWRDMVVMPTATTSPPWEPDDPRRVFGATAFQNSSILANPDINLYPLGKPDQWPDRFIQIDWYLTQEHNFFVRIDKQFWYKAQVDTDHNETSYHFRGFAAGWISSVTSGYVDIKSVKLYDDSCFK